MKNRIEAYKALADAFVSEYNVKVGDTLKVLRIAKTDELGWDTSWNEEMDAAVGKEFVLVSQGTYSKNFELKTRGVDGMSQNFYFPFFVLEKTKAGFEPIVIPLTPDYNAEVQQDASVHVGCQKIPFDVLESVYLAAKKVKETP